MIKQPRDILVAEGSQEISALLEMILGTEGHTVRTATSLDELLAALTHRLPDVIITETRLAGAAPFAVLDRLDTEPRTRGLPVIICSSHIDDLLNGHVHLQRPRTEILLKPFDIDGLLDCIARVTAAGGSKPT